MVTIDGLQKEKKMELTKITHEAYGEKQTIEFYAGSTIDEYMNQIERLLIAASFHPESVKDGFVTKAEEIELNESTKIRYKDES